jgi:hypothetical protein
MLLLFWIVIYKFVLFNPKLFIKKKNPTNQENIDIVTVFSLIVIAEPTPTTA